jgi:hypothetical protein
VQRFDTQLPGGVPSRRRVPLVDHRVALRSPARAWPDRLYLDAPSRSRRDGSSPLELKFVLRITPRAPLRHDELSARHPVRDRARWVSEAEQIYPTTQRWRCEAEDVRASGTADPQRTTRDCRRFSDADARTSRARHFSDARRFCVRSHGPPLEEIHGESKAIHRKE